MNRPEERSRAVDLRYCSGPYVLRGLDQQQATEILKGP